MSSIEPTHPDSSIQLTSAPNTNSTQEQDGPTEQLEPATVVGVALLVGGFIGAMVLVVAIEFVRHQML